jgi:hypothetical protein
VGESRDVETMRKKERICEGKMPLMFGDEIVIHLFICGFFNDTTVFSYKHQVSCEFCFCVNSLVVMF